MRSLTIPQPWAAVLTTPGLHGRRVVTRRFPATYRGRLVLIAGPPDYAALRHPHLAAAVEDAALDLAALPVAAGLALATLTDCHPAAGACCAPWGIPGPFFHLVLDDIRPLAAPVRLPGRPGLPELPAKEHNAVLAAL